MKVFWEALVLILNSVVLGGLCYNSTKMGELPPGIASQLLSILTKQSIRISEGCKNVIEDDIKLLLYTREAGSDPTILNLTNPIAIDSERKIIIFIHGWITNRHGYHVSDLRDAYLKRYDCNYILLDWSKLAWGLYTNAVCSGSRISEIVADFFCLLDKNMSIPLSSVHLLGHSMGGQIAGLIGKEALARCNKSVGRITALDPAGPLYQKFKSSKRLVRTDANFVDVIHTNEGGFGYLGSCGDVDFHVNCGVVQLGCPDTKLDIKSIVGMPVELVACHHARSLDYMIESITSDSFQARICSNCPRLCIPNILSSIEVTIGEDCPKDVPAGAYVLATHFEAPYMVWDQQTF